MKQVPGRKSDWSDCQWIQYLHSMGLLAAAFRPAEQVVLLRSYTRQRALLVKDAAREILHIQQALTLMNLKLQHVVSDISGLTGMAIIRAIVGGERDPFSLAQLRDSRCKNDVATIAAALHGHWRDDHLFCLKQALTLFDVFQERIRECDEAILHCLGEFPSEGDSHALPAPRKGLRRDRKSRPQPLRGELFRISGVDLTSIDGLDDASVLSILSEVGTDMSRFPTAKHFASWLHLCPAHAISGGKVLKRRTLPTASRAATSFRLAAMGLHRSQSALGAFFRRKRAQKGTAEAITATAHRLARIFYTMLKTKTSYADAGADYFEAQHRTRLVALITRRALSLGLQVSPLTGVS